MKKINFNPPDYFMVLLIISIILHFILPLKKIVSFPYNYSGILLISFGIYLNLWVHFKYKKLKNPIEVEKKPKVFLTSGPFKFSRNPMYLGMLSILLGTSLLLGSLISFIFPVIFLLLINNVTIPIEEKNMEEKFGGKYAHYKNKVRRWI